MIQLCNQRAGVRKHIKSTTAVMRSLQDTLLCKFTDSNSIDEEQASTHVRRQSMWTYTLKKPRGQHGSVRYEQRSSFLYWFGKKTQSWVVGIYFSALCCVAKLFWTLGIRHVPRECHPNSSSREPVWIIWGDQSRRCETTARNTEGNRTSLYSLITWFVLGASWLKNKNRTEAEVKPLFWASDQSAAQ